jgi:DNA-binding CsgD family transcriptional regulator
VDGIQEWLRPIGLLNHLFAVVERQNSGVMLLVLARCEGKPDFEDDIVGEIETLIPALDQALRAGRGVRQLRALQRAALRAIDVMPMGVMMLDQNCAVIGANRSARAVLEAGEGLIVANGGLAVDIGGRQLKVRELITRTDKQATAFAAGELTLLPVRRQPGQRPLTLLLMPLEQTIEPGIKQVPVALLFIGDPERSVSFDQTRIARLYGLSRAESRVAALLASGYRLEQVAESLDIAYEMRKHLKQIFGKTGTYRQAELVRMLVTGPAGLWT